MSDPTTRLELGARIRILEEALFQAPDDPDLHLDRAYLYARMGRFSQDALPIYDKALSVDPGHRASMEAVSVCYLLQSVNDMVAEAANGSERNTPALEHFAESVLELLQQYPQSSELLKAMGDLALLRRDDQRATEFFRETIKLNHEALTSLLGTVALAETLEGLHPQLATFLSDAIRRIGRAERAYELLRRAFASNPDRTLASRMVEILERDLLPNADASRLQDLRLDLCRLHLRLNEPTMAIGVYRTLSAKQALEDEAFAKSLARAFIQVEDYRGAFELLSRVAMDAEVKGMLNESAAALESRGEHDSAAFLLQYINRQDLVAPVEEKIDAQDYEIEQTAQLELAELNMRKDRPERAFENYMSALRLGARWTAELDRKLHISLAKTRAPRIEDLCFLGKVCMDGGDPQASTHYLKRAYELDPDNAETLERLRENYNVLLEFDPRDPEWLLQSSLLHTRMGEHDAAVEQARLAVEVSPDPESADEAGAALATALLRSGSPMEALEQIESLEPRVEILPLLYDTVLALENAGWTQKAYEGAVMLQNFRSDFRDIEEVARRVAAAFRKEQTESQFNLIRRDPKMVELIGETAIGRYRYIEKIGSGGMGVVHKVWDERNERVVAMKILRDSLTQSRKAIERFFREARIAATLNHKNIVAILDYHISRQDGASYIAMEFIDGPSLRDVIEKRMNESVDLDPDYIAKMIMNMMQLCNALQATHKRGLIHRDIKPDNILITADGFVKITDFGIVHVDDATFTPTGALIGTPRYMSPEQVKGERIDGRADLYAVGVILYELLAGTPPFISGDVAYQHVNIEPQPLTELSRLISAPLNETVLRCLAKKPDDRFVDALALRDALHETLRVCFPAQFSFLDMRAVNDSQFDASLDI